jgi:hypothetical protein
MAEIVAPYFDVANPSSYIDNSTASWEELEIRTGLADASLYNTSAFRLDNNYRDSWILPSEAVIEVRAKIVGAGGKPTTYDDTLRTRPSLTNNWAFALFQSARLLIENNEIAQCGNPHKMGLIRDLIFMSREEADVQGCLQSFHRNSKNVAVSNTHTTPSYSAPASTDEREYAKLVSLWDGLFDNVGGTTYLPLSGVKASVSKEVVARIPLKSLFPVLGQYNKVMRGSSISVQLNRQTSMEKILLIPDEYHTGASVQITGLTCWYPTLKASPSVELSINEFYRNNPKQSIRYGHIEIFEQTFTHSASQQTYKVATDSARPLSVAVAFQLSSRDSSKTLDNSVFDHINLSSIHLRVNGKVLPMEQYNFSFASGVGMTNPSRMLNDIYRYAGSQVGSGKGHLISMDNYVNTYPIVVFNLQGEGQSAFADAQRSDLEIRWNSSSATYPLGGTAAASIVCYVVVESERVLGVNAMDKVISFQKL